MYRKDSVSLSFLHLFWTDFQKLTKNSNVSRQLWFTLTGVTMVSFSTIKWWSKYDVLEQLYNYFGDLLTWLESCIANGVSVEPACRLVNMLADPSSMHFSKIEFSVYIFVGGTCGSSLIGLRAALHLTRGCDDSCIP